MHKTEIVGITKHGIWLIVRGKEYFLPYSEFPWFKKTIVEDIYDVRLLHENHLYWPKLDIDIHIESIEELEKYPLIANQ